MKTKQTTLDGRFAGILGSEYEKLLRAMPHYLELQNAIALHAAKALPFPRPAKLRMVLDLGCGTGLTTCALMHVVKWATIVAVDKEPTMLQQYKRNIIQGRKSALVDYGLVVKAFQSDILTFLKGCKKNSFDAVVSGFVLHNLPKALRAEILKEVGRVLRPEGVFVNGDKIAPDDIDLHNKYLMQQLTTFVKTYTAPEDAAYCIGWIEHYAVDNQPELRYTEAEVNSSLKAAGFRNVKIVERHCMEAVVVATKK
jgi:ubiquinone/menaquinone biosynthesis C-methylase UbiE